MSLSRAELEAMDKDELIDEIVGLNQRLSDTQTVLYERVLPRLDDLEERVATLEDENERLRSRLDDTGGKEQKVRNIVQFALNYRDAGQPVVELKASHIKGATGCSRRYAYDLMANLPDEYDWCLRPPEMSKRGSLVIDKDPDDRRLGIDIEGVHSSGCPVNKFTTRGESERGEQ